MLWLSIPCTGGCRYAIINAAKCDKAKVRLAKHWKVFDGLWANAVRVMRFAKQYGAKIAIEFMQTHAVDIFIDVRTSIR